MKTYKLVQFTAEGRHTNAMVEDESGEWVRKSDFVDTIKQEALFLSNLKLFLSNLNKRVERNNETMKSLGDDIKNL